MRTIKFRAWDKKHNVMIYDVVTIIENQWTVNFDRVEIETADGRAYLEDRDPVPMQSTGLKDKNGTEIYEGDIVKTETGLYEVVWGYQQCSFYLGIIQGHSYTALQMYQAMDNEVIGNIYENKELLA